MVKRRSLDDALTPEEEAFLKQEKPTKPAKNTPSPKAKTKKENPSMPRTALKEIVSADEPSSKSAASYASAATGASNGAINARIDPAITNALLRSSFERRLSGQMPHTQREIIAEALSD